MDAATEAAGTHSQVRAPYERTRGPKVVSWCYLVWRQGLAFADLLGKDGRPSSTKLIAWEMVHALVLIGLIRAWKGAEEAWSWPMFWTGLGCFAVLFGRAHFDKYLDLLRDKHNPPGLDG